VGGVMMVIIGFFAIMSNAVQEWENEAVEKIKINPTADG
jgi:hypothetical protein